VQDGAVTGVELEGCPIIKSPLLYLMPITEKLHSFCQMHSLIKSGNNIKDAAHFLSLYCLPGVKRDLVDLSAFRGDHLFVKLKEGKPVPWVIKSPFLKISGRMRYGFPGGQGTILHLPLRDAKH